MHPAAKNAIRRAPDRINQSWAIFSASQGGGSGRRTAKEVHARRPRPFLTATLMHVLAFPVAHPVHFNVTSITIPQASLCAKPVAGLLLWALPRQAALVRKLLS